LLHRHTATPIVAWQRKACHEILLRIIAKNELVRKVEVSRISQMLLKISLGSVVLLALLLPALGATSTLYTYNTVNYSGDLSAQRTALVALYSATEVCDSAVLQSRLLHFRNMFHILHGRTSSTQVYQLPAL
jgi:hypothetical protein